MGRDELHEASTQERRGCGRHYAPHPTINHESPVILCQSCQLLLIDPRCAHTHPNVTQVESHIDIAAARRADEQARASDTISMDELLTEFAASEKKLSDLINADRLDRRAEMVQIKDLMYLCMRQIQSVPPATPERRFYESTYRKMVRLSGGHGKPAPKWIVSPLEVDREEGKRTHSNDVV